MGKVKLKHNKPGSKTNNMDCSWFAAYMQRVVKDLSFERVYDTPANITARDYVKKEFDKVLKNGAGSTIESEGNIVSHSGYPKVLIGAHYDSVPGTLGADDNASAVAVLLAAMKYFGSQRQDITYVAFNGEECGLLGSRCFVEKNLSHNIKHVHILEMVGYTDKRPNSQKSPIPFLEVPTTGDFLGVLSNQEKETNTILEQADYLNTPVIGLTLPFGIPLNEIKKISSHLLRSDHAPFWELHPEIGTTMWTDTSEFRNPHYHKPTDSPDTLDYEFMAEVFKLLVMTVDKQLKG